MRNLSSVMLTLLLLPAGMSIWLPIDDVGPGENGVTVEQRMDAHFEGEGDVTMSVRMEASSTVVIEEQQE